MQQLLAKLEKIRPYIGKTPLLQLFHSFNKPGVEVWLKIEWQQFGGSVKSRAAFNIIWDGIQNGTLTKNKSILDSTSGNTGISYAMIAARLGLRCTIIMPDNVTEERKSILLALGAEILYVSGDMTGDEVHQFAKDTYASDPEKYFYANQYDNPSNWQAHYQTTGLEVFDQTSGTVTHFAAALGTTGTFTGPGRRLNELDPNIKIIGLNVAEQENEIEGWKHLASSEDPEIYDHTLADEHLFVTTDEAFGWVRKLARQEGLLVSPSSAAAVAGAVQLAQRIDKGVIVTVLPDDGSKYGEIMHRIFA